MTTKIVIVGSGFGMYGLLPAFSRIEECKVVSICGKNSERMQNYCKKLSLNRYTDWREMLQKEKPDAVAIAVIPKHQYEIAKYALESGISVFAEKPLTTSFDTSLELNKLAKKPGHIAEPCCTREATPCEHVTVRSASKSCAILSRGGPFWF